MTDHQTEKAQSYEDVLNHEYKNPPAEMNPAAQAGWSVAMARVLYLIETGALVVPPDSSTPEVATKTSGEPVDLLAALQRSIDAAKGDSRG